MNGERMADRPEESRRRTAFREALARGSLGAPDAQALIAEGRRLSSGQDSLTGMPEEQADWDGATVERRGDHG